jgi:hypothetical protein
MRYSPITIVNGNAIRLDKCTVYRKVFNYCFRIDFLLNTCDGNEPKTGTGGRSWSFFFWSQFNHLTYVRRRYVTSRCVAFNHMCVCIVKQPFSQFVICEPVNSSCSQLTYGISIKWFV